MGVNSLSKTVTRQRRDCDLNPGPSAPESSTLTTRLYLAIPRIKYVVCIREWESICGLYSQLFSDNERIFKVRPLQTRTP